MQRFVGFVLAMLMATGSAWVSQGSAWVRRTTPMMGGFGAKKVVKAKPLGSGVKAQRKQFDEYKRLKKGGSALYDVYVRGMPSLACQVVGPLSMLGSFFQEDIIP